MKSTFARIVGFAFSFALVTAMGNVAQAVPPLLADEAQIITCTSDLAAQQEIRLVVNSAGQAVGMRHYGGRNGTRTYNLAQLRQGAILNQRSRGPFTRDVLVLSADAGTNANGGSLTLKILREYGVFSNDYRLLHLEIRREPHGWQAYLNERARTPFRSLYFEGLRSGDPDPQGNRYRTGGNGDPVGIKLVFASQDGRTGSLYNTVQLREE
jgi:hypothetical protein